MNGPDGLPGGVPPWWTRALLRRLAPRGREAEVLGDLEEAHRARARRRGRMFASLATTADALDMAVALVRERLRGGRSADRRGRRTGRGRGRPWRGPSRGGHRISLLDFKLGLRMLVRYPGLAAVAGVSMTFAVAVGAGAFEFMKDAMYPTLPLPDGDRVVRLHVVDARAGRRTAVSPADFARWRAELRSVRELGAFHEVSRVLSLGDGAAVPLDGVAVSAAAFDVVRTAPLLGRPLVAADEGVDAPPVVVLGHGLWRSLFAGDPGVVGRVVGVGASRATIVGVMPEHFGFPVTADLYVPLGLDELAARARGGGAPPSVTGFGRLAAHATMEGANAELAALGLAPDVVNPGTFPHPTPEVGPFAYPIVTTSGIATNAIFALTAFLLAMLMVVVCANVALLLFARAATREAEIAVRAALGAGRGRIVVQLFVEALVLAGVATTAGLWAASAGLTWAVGLINWRAGEALPFWVGDTLSPETVGWTVLLALLGAGVAGVTPALQITGRDLHTNLQRGAGRGSGPCMGGIWTGVVVTQVAITVMFIPVVFVVASFYRTVRSAEPGFAAEEYLVARLEPEEDRAAFEDAARALRSRLLADPRVLGVTLSDRTWPGWTWSRPIEVEGPAPAPRTEDERRALHMAVDADFFEVLGARTVEGRPLSAEDEGRPVIVVNESFVERVLGGRNAVGRRLRIGGMEDVGEAPADAGPAPWREIVGVVADLGLNPHADLPHRGVIFHPLSTGGATRLSVTVRTAGAPDSFAPPLRLLALQLERPLRVDEPVPLEHLMARPGIEYGAWVRVVGTAGALALLLTLTGIYAVMSFTVSRRTREIGVRVALGGAPARIAATVLAGTVRRVGYGVLAGGSSFPC